MTSRGTPRGPVEVVVVYDPPPLLAGLIAQQCPDLTEWTCQGCDGTGRAYLTRFAPRESACRECAGAGVIHIPTTDFTTSEKEETL